MTLAKVEGAPALARWTGRLALFSAVLLIFGLVAHRFLGMETPVLLALLKLAYAGAIAAMAMGVLASIGIWRHGTPVWPGW